MLTTAQLIRYFHWIGSGLGLLGVVFVTIRFSEYWSNQVLSSSIHMTFIAPVIIGLAIFYALSSTMLALAWRQLLIRFGNYVNPAWAIRTYGISQLAKYIPGNIFHLASRQAMGMAAGLSGWGLGKSAIWEHCLLLMTGLLYGCLITPICFTPQLQPWVGMAAFIGIGSFILLIARKFFGLELVWTIAFQNSFIIIMGFIFIVVFSALGTEVDLKKWSYLLGAYVLSWVVGFITPGAPAGIGIREATLILLLKDIFQEEELVLAVVLVRVITVLGDCLYWAALVVNKNNIFK